MNRFLIPDNDGRVARVDNVQRVKARKSKGGFDSIDIDSIKPSMMGGAVADAGSGRKRTKKTSGKFSGHDDDSDVLEDISEELANYDRGKSELSPIMPSGTGGTPSKHAAIGRDTAEPTPSATASYGSMGAAPKTAAPPPTPAMGSKSTASPPAPSMGGKPAQSAPAPVAASAPPLVAAKPSSGGDILARMREALATANQQASTATSSYTPNVSSSSAPIAPASNDILARMRAALAATEQQVGAGAAMAQQEKDNKLAKQKAAMNLISKINKGLYADNPAYQAAMRAQAEKDAGMVGRDTSWL